MIKMGSVTTRFTCTNDKNFTNFNFTTKIFSENDAYKHVYNTKVEVIKRIRANTDLHNQEDLNG